ncbi:MAG: signal peptidase I [Rhodospirillaceae bacterium]|nr:signal peptidase I [Rhodospirillaceae bacterium]
MTPTTTKKSGGIRELLRTIIVAVLIAVGIRTFVYEPFNIPSGSMIPTLLVGDYLFVSKMSYGYSRYSLPLSPPLIPGRVLFTEPERGDVIVFKKPTDTSVDYIKRVIGLPGDKIQMHKGRLYISGKLVNRRQVDDFLSTDRSGRTVRVPQYIETLPNGAEYSILETWGDHGPADNSGVYTVPAGFYFMMGDNRDNSVDSRAPGVGMVPRQNLVGRAEVLIFSRDQRWRWWEIWNWPDPFRFGRILQGIQ